MLVILGVSLLVCDLLVSVVIQDLGFCAPLIVETVERSESDGEVLADIIEHAKENTNAADNNDDSDIVDSDE